MKKQGGFTLIELVVVIVILGILAVTAAPKFLDMQGEARKGVLNGVKGAMQGSAGMIYAKSAINGEEGVAADATTTPSVSADGTTINTHYGYPVPKNTNGIGDTLDLDADNLQLVEDSDNDTLYVIFSGASTDITAITAANCHVSYKMVDSGTSADKEPTIVVNADGC
ncbi:MSHA biogenesis protein MshA [Vibrio albus]|uniref:MSHA biogenesis protein MshA n=1 Tax=Vibrio albus TaxID=2200953 RepID=A0A2U3B5M5_9VIBR|nr:type II secretion system protein [Vibrio albus]PWI32015.1 MSHA biogenesis protein MshA [Vibrio albus]